ncbi:MAG: response regulator transcription factor [Betaproteobacteria bacterium]|nr:response regulator transcription factor [Betaproteobacteria bacterium]MBI2959207.1 response regulator transcription factor [Betaproteobacteria bacterium]
MSIQVLLVDDHTILRMALRVLLAREPDIKVVADVDRGSEALRLAQELAPEVVVMDIGMPGMDGIDATRQLLASVPGVKVLALSTHLERHFIVQMLEAGAGGYVVKSAEGDELLRGIRAVAQGRTYLCAEAASVMVDSMRQKTPAQEANGERLGRREREVLALLAEGKTSQEIAAKLHIATGTVIAHRRNISRKLGLHSVAELTKYAIREGLTSS